MTKEELEKEAEDKGVEYADSINCTISKFSDENGYCWGQVEEAYEKGALDFAEPREKQIEEKDKQIAELKEFYEKEYFEIADRTADEKIKELEKYQTEVTVDDYSPYDENTWGMMHEEMFVPKELVRDLLKESYALSEHRKDNLTKAKEIIQLLLNDFLYLCDMTNNSSCYESIEKANQFLKEE